jgi:hypothetical protein
VPAVLFPVLLLGRRVRALSRSSQDSIADVGTYANEIIQQIKTPLTTLKTYSPSLEEAYLEIIGANTNQMDSQEASA